MEFFSISGSNKNNVPTTKDSGEMGKKPKFKSYSCDKVDSNDDSEDENLSDEGDLSDNIASTFTTPYHLETENSMSLSDIIVLHLCGTTISNPKLGVALSDYTCNIYDVEKMSKLSTLKGHRSSISNLKFSPKTDSLLYSASVDGLLKLWDLRAKNTCVKEFKDDTGGESQLKPLSSFDVSCNDRFLCAGTELVGGDAFLLFWDVRTSNLLGGYWESHMDVITHVAFHPTQHNVVASGSTDGLINVFDISLDCEDDALQHCLNTESSVEKIGWFTHKGNNALSCITHTEHLQLWEVEEAAPYLHIDREKLTRSLFRNPSDNCYLVDVHPSKSSEQLTVVAGSAAGNGECLRMLRVADTHVKPTAQLLGNQQIVRASWYNDMDEMLITGGESGFLSVWKPGKAEEISSAHLKVISSVKVNKSRYKSKPY